MSLATTLTVKEIQQAIVSHGAWKYRENIFVPNLSWGLLPYEADLVILNKRGYLTEIEIKRSWEDFMADFKKSHTHDAPQVYELYYCLPKALVDKARAWYKEQGRGEGCDNGNFAVLSYDENGNVTEERGFGWSHQPNRRKLFIEEQLQVARLGCMRLWNVKKE